MVFSDHSYRVPISVFLFLHWDSMYGIVPGAFWARVNELHCVHAFWQLILWRPCLENFFLQVFLSELDFLVKKPTYTLKIFASIFWFTLSLFSCYGYFINRISEICWIILGKFIKSHAKFSGISVHPPQLYTQVVITVFSSIALGHCHGFQHFMIFFIFYLRILCSL